MPKTESERNAEWRARLLLRGTFFDDTDQRRRNNLRGSILDDKSPEAKALVSFFKAYPRCFTLPESAGLNKEPDETPWMSVYLPYDEHTAFEAAAAFVALSEISSLYVQIEYVGDGKSGMYTIDSFPAQVAQVREEVAAMRRLGMWHTA